MHGESPGDLLAKKQLAVEPVAMKPLARNLFANER
jgi:hypothetical protein